MKVRRKILKILLALGAVLLLVGVWAWFLPNQVLTVDSGPVQGDVIVLLGGGNGEERPERAAESFKAGEAPRVICSGSGDCQSNRAQLVAADVPRPVIQLECDSRNTSENARFTIPMLRKLGAKRVIIVTSWYHSRRALNCFEHYAPDLTFYSRPSYYGAPRTEWKSKGLAGYVRLEYLKNLGYWVRYGVSPF